jgi:hypothetical protein
MQNKRDLIGILMLMIKSEEIMIDRNNRIFMIPGCRKGWAERKKDGMMSIKSNKYKLKKGYIIKKYCSRTRETAMGKSSYNTD